MCTKSCPTLRLRMESTPPFVRVCVRARMCEYVCMCLCVSDCLPVCFSVYNWLYFRCLSLGRGRAACRSTGSVFVDVMLSHTVCVCARLPCVVHGRARRVRSPGAARSCHDHFDDQRQLWQHRHRFSATSSNAAHFHHSHDKQTIGGCLLHRLIPSAIAVADH